MPRPEQVAIFPIPNVSLHQTSTVLIRTGRNLIKRARMAAHRAGMVAALVTSAVLFISYVYRHAHVGCMHLQGQGWSRPLYFTILGSHRLRALGLWPTVIIALNRAIRERFDHHPAIARRTFPVWL